MSRLRLIETHRDSKIWRMSRPRPTVTHQKVLRLRPRVSLLTGFYQVSQKNLYIRFIFFSQKHSVTKWGKLILTKCLSIWVVDFSKLSSIKMPLKRTRAKRVVKNLTSCLALVFILSWIKRSDFWQCDIYWLWSSKLKKKGFCHITQKQSQTGSGLPVWLYFSQEHKF